MKRAARLEKKQRVRREQCARRALKHAKGVHFQCDIKAKLIRLDQHMREWILRQT